MKIELNMIDLEVLVLLQKKQSKSFKSKMV